MKGHFTSKYQQQLFLRLIFICEFSAMEWSQIRSINVMVSQAIPKMDSRT